MFEVELKLLCKCVLYVFVYVDLAACYKPLILKEEIHLP
jgi:hypothetical protein